MKYQVWFAHGYNNQSKLGESDDFTEARALANSVAETGSEDVEVLVFDAAGKAAVHYKTGFSQLDEFCNF